MRLLRRHWGRPWRIALLMALLLLLPASFESAQWLANVPGYRLGNQPGDRLSNASALAESLSEQILVDQFGWRSQAVKVALFANPRQGQNAQLRYEPGARFELRQEDNGQSVYQGALIPWRHGETDASSGDQVWSGDFSAFTTPGSYYIYDPKNRLRSHGFEIQANPYGDVLTAAVRAFYYQRCGIKIAPQFGGNWVHPPCHIGPRQDLAAAPWVDHPTGAQPGQPIHRSTPASLRSKPQTRDVHGGWHDAGDFNKYLPFTAKTLWNLIDAYEHNPQAFGDRTQIPESGNGVPDLLDELKWELDWMLRMQLEDGSVANRVASNSFEAHPPDQDAEPRYYTEPTTWATAAFIVGSANASRIFQPFESVYPGYGARLLRAAKRAWDFLETTPRRSPSSGKDHGSKPQLSPASQANEDGEDGILRLWAAAELYRATQSPVYQRYIESQPVTLASDWFDAYRDLAYVTYARTPGASPKMLVKLRAALQATLDNIDNLDPSGPDPYRAYLDYYHWGSNQSKANWGLMFLLAQQIRLKGSSLQAYRQNAEEYLHYFHGRNPLGWVYLSNMGEQGAKAGAEKSVMAIYHGWFHRGSVYDGAASKYGPAPGFVSGGPNQYYSVKHVAPPYGEPPQKAYRDWNVDKPMLGMATEASWEITEPAIYYQAAYVDLLSYFVGSQ
ncbi:MAG: hypothetical protein HC771_05320 [Synechococcales cyanobacterium CRU_2_2]|nr:hypothetical protein [Synechococcales cyanobacterium CRU_2_2]